MIPDMDPVWDENITKTDGETGSDSVKCLLTR